MNRETGILLTNLGTPDAPTPRAVRRYLKEFLSDPYVVKLPRAVWYPILYAYILPFRSKKSAKLYQSIWTEEGSPLLCFSKKIAQGLERKLNIPVALGMRYGNPSLKQAISELISCEVKEIIVLPLYPQYSDTTTKSTSEEIKKIITGLPRLHKTQARNDVANDFYPEVLIADRYFDNRHYIHALSHSIQTHWQKQGHKNYLLFSFHGLPKQFADAGDPYPEQCHRTAQLIAEELQLSPHEWSVAFQSRLGRAEWLKPYTDVVLESLPNRGIQSVDVICPGFPADCLETLEEIAIRGKQQFLQQGGKVFNYISALNDSADHIDALAAIITTASSSRVKARGIQRLSTLN